MLGTYTSHKILLAFSCVFVTCVSSFSTHHVKNSSPSRHEERTQYVPMHPPDCLPTVQTTVLKRLDFYFQNPRNDANKNRGLNPRAAQKLREAQSKPMREEFQSRKDAQVVADWNA